MAVAIDSKCVSYWHETVMPALLSQVRYEEVNGPSSVLVRGPFLTPNCDIGTTERPSMGFIIGT
jgi:hypothetical protein